MVGQLLLVCLALVLLALSGWAYAGDRVPAGVPNGKRAKPWILLAVASAAIVLGIIGWCIQQGAATTPGSAGQTAVLPADGGVAKFINAVYLAAQQISLNAPADAGQNEFIHASRLCALATVVLVAIEALSQLFADSIHLALLHRIRGHVVIAGLGRTGFALLQDLGRRRGGLRRRVVVIEHDKENPLADAARERGAIVVHGDATDERLLKRVRAERAEAVFFATGSDEANVEGVRDLLEVIGEHRRPDEPQPKAFAHLRRADLGLLLEAAAGPEPVIDVRAFNILHRAAADVVLRHLPHPELRPRQPHEMLHAVIIGMGPMAQVLATQIAEFAHFENLKRSRMTIVHSPRDREAVSEFRATYQRLFHAPPGASRWDPWDPPEAMDHWSYGVAVRDVEAPSAADRGIGFVVNGGFAEHDGELLASGAIDRIAEIAHREGVKPVVFVCAEDDEKNCSVAYEIDQELRARLCKDGSYRPGVQPVTIFAHVPYRKVLGAAVERGRLKTFGDLTQLCSYDELTWSGDQELAKAIAQRYEEKYPKPAGGKHRVDLERWARRSNFSAAMHASVKFATLGYALARRQPGETAEPITPKVTDAQRSVIQRMEHNRWLAERLLSGWTFGPRDDVRRQRTAIVDWDHLPLAERQKDDDQIQAILDALRITSTIAVQPLRWTTFGDA
jgi:hypothetical protein